MGDEVVLGSVKKDYFGVVVDREGATDSSVLRRVKCVQAALRVLVVTYTLVKDMDAQKEVEFQQSF